MIVRPRYFRRVLEALILCFAVTSCAHFSNDANRPSLMVDSPVVTDAQSMPLLVADGNESDKSFRGDATYASIEQRVTRVANDLATLKQEHEHLRPTIIQMMQVNEDIDSILRQIEGILEDQMNTLAATPKLSQQALTDVGLSALPSTSLVPPMQQQQLDTPEREDATTVFPTVASDTPTDSSKPDEQSFPPIATPSSLPPSSPAPSVLPTLVIPDTQSTANDEHGDEASIVSMGTEEDTNKSSNEQIHQPPQSMGGKFYLHIASYLSEDSARQQWEEFQRHNPEVLGDLGLHLSTIKLRGKSFTRMVGGPLADHNDAYDRCRKLAALGIYCRVIAK